MSSLPLVVTRRHAASREKLLLRIGSALQCAAAMTLAACGGGGSTPEAAVATDDAVPTEFRTGSTSVVITTVLPPEIRPGNGFGARTVLRDNGNTLIVAAPTDRLNPITGTQFLESWGSVHIFTRDSAGAWQQTALLRPPVGPNDGYANELAVSGDGNTIAVGAPEDRSHGSGIGSDPLDHEPYGCAEPPCIVRYIRGAVWVYVKQGGTWQLQEFIKSAVPWDGALFGYSVSLSHDGNSMAVGAPNDLNSGAVHLFRRDAAGQWTLAQVVTASNPRAGVGFGWPVRLSADGSVLAVGTTGEMSAACEIDGNQRDISQPQAGAVYMFERTGDVMVQRAYIKACERRGMNQFGTAIAMNPAGTMMAVGAPGEDAEIHSCSAHNVPYWPQVGRVYLFTRGSAGWVRSGALGASNSGYGDEFGSDVKMSADGSTLAIGARGEDSGQIGINPPQGDDGVQGSGAIYLFRRGADASYAQTHYIKPPREGPLPWNHDIGDQRHTGLDLGDDGSTLVIGAPFSGATPGMPDELSGAVYVYDGLF